MTNTNVCDKCLTLIDSEDMIWLTSEEFTPLEGEVLKPGVFDKNNCLDSVCRDCYKTLLVKSGDK